MERVQCLGDHEGVRVTNGEVDVVATTDIGPRIVEYRFRDGANVLGEALDASIETALGTWRPYGGHRLWAAPEVNPRSYSPDNDPVEATADGERSVELTAPVESATGLQKSIAITVDESGSGVTVVHRIVNTGMWTIELAPWALTIMREGGEAIVPPEPFQTHAQNLLPVRTLALWGYTDLSDSRITLGSRYLRVRSDTAISIPIKIGIANARRWAGWHRDGTLFIKQYGFDETATYPDMGCNTEIFTAGDFIELESLGPLQRVAPGASVEHVERWRLFDDVIIAAADDVLESALEPLIDRL